MEQVSAHIPRDLQSDLLHQVDIYYKVSSSYVIDM